MSKLMKTERVLEGSLCGLFMVLLSLCDSDTKNQVESTNEFTDLEKKIAKKKGSSFLLLNDDKNDGSSDIVYDKYFITGSSKCSRRRRRETESEQSSDKEDIQKNYSDDDEEETLSKIHRVKHDPKLPGYQGQHSACQRHFWSEH